TAERPRRGRAGGAVSATPTTAAPLPAPAGRESGATPWGALLASALVGTARRPPPPPGALALALGLGPGPGPGIGYGGGGPGAGIDVGGGGGLTAGIDLDRGDSAAALLAAAAVLS